MSTRNNCQQVRQKLKRQLDVQLTESNVVQIIEIQPVLDKHHQNNQRQHELASNSDAASLIHELGKLDQSVVNAVEYLRFDQRNKFRYEKQHKPYRRNKEKQHQQQQQLGNNKQQNKVKTYQIENKYCSGSRKQLNKDQVNNNNLNKKVSNKFSTSKELRKNNIGSKHNRKQSGYQQQQPQQSYQLEKMINSKQISQNRQTYKNISNNIQQKNSILPEQLLQIKLHKKASQDFLYSSQRKHQNQQGLLLSLTKQQALLEVLRNKISQLNQQEELGGGEDCDSQVIDEFGSIFLLKHHKSSQKIMSSQKFISRNYQQILRNNIQPQQQRQICKQNNQSHHFQLKSNDKKYPIIQRKESNKDNNMMIGTMSSESKSKQKKILKMIEQRRNTFHKENDKNRKLFCSVDDKTYLANQHQSWILQFNQSKIIKHYSDILKQIPRCSECSQSYGAVSLSQSNLNKIQTVCNQCELKAGTERSVSYTNIQEKIKNQNQSIHNHDHNHRDILSINHPIIGVLFDIQTKKINQNSLRIYNNLLQNISKELCIVQEMKSKLQWLHRNITSAKYQLRKSSKSIFDVKTKLKDIFSETSTSQDRFINFKHVQKLVPADYLEELNIWSIVRSKSFAQWPSIQTSLQNLSPLYLKKSFSTMNEFLRPLLFNFEDISVRISVSEGIKLPVKSLANATLVVDGSYNISHIEKIEKLSLQFQNKRTFREITSTMQNLPATINELYVTYDHRQNSHISAERYPLLTKVCSIRSCKKLQALIENCKDQADLLSAMKNITRKIALNLKVTRSIYVRQAYSDGTLAVKDMLKKLGKNIVSVCLELPISINHAEIYKELLMTQRNKLMQFQLMCQSDEQNQQQSIQRNNRIIVGNKIHQPQHNNTDNLLSAALQAINEEQRIKKLKAMRIQKQTKIKRIFDGKIKIKTQALALFLDLQKRKRQLRRMQDQKYLVAADEPSPNELPYDECYVAHQNKSNIYQKQYSFTIDILKMLM